MRSATQDLLRLSLTAIAMAALLLLANFQASRAFPPVGGAMARTDSIDRVRPIPATRLDVGQPPQPEPEGVTPADSIAKHSGKLRTLLALAQ